jgi:hypothetical protein
MDDKDRACFGHSLELLEDGRKVEWRGSTSDMVYALTPYGRFEREGRVCRKFTVVRILNGPARHEGRQRLPLRRGRLAHDQGLTRSAAAG